MSTETVTAAPDTTKAAETVKETLPQTDAEKFYAKPEGEAVKETETKTVEEAKKEEVKAEFELKLMEGSILDQSQVEKIAAIAKARGLSQEAAQEILTAQDELLSGFRDQQLQQHMEARKAWVDSIKQDKEYGGDKLNENLEIAKRMINEFADEELKVALNETGYGDHPALFKFVVKIGQKLKVLNDSYVKASAPAAQKREPHEIFYSKG